MKNRNPKARGSGSGGVWRALGAVAGMVAGSAGAMGQIGSCTDGPGETFSGVRGFGMCVKKIVPVGIWPLAGIAVGSPYEGVGGVVRVYDAARGIVYTIPFAEADRAFGLSIESDAMGYGFGFPVLTVGATGANLGSGGVELIDLLSGGSVGQIPGAGFGSGYRVVNMVFPTLPGQTNPPGPSLVIGTESSNTAFFFHPGAEEPVELSRGANFEGFGAAIIHFGDVNGDGVPDVAVGAERKASGSQGFAGEVSIYSGATLFPGAPTPIVPLHTMALSVAGDLFGHALLDVGDINSDGVEDLAASSMPCALVASPCNAGIGYVKFFSGATGAFLRQFTNPTSRRLGESLALVHDIDNDGHNDVAVGAMGDNQTRGVVYVISPMDGHIINTIHGGSVGSGFGFSLEPYIDLTGDGKAELLVGAPALDNSSAAKVHILGDLSTPPPAITQSPSAPCIGETVTLSASSTMTGTLRYRWFVAAPATAPMVAVSNGPTGRGSTYTGADTGALTISNLALADHDVVYSCLVTPEDALGAPICLRSVLSAPTPLVMSVLTITQEPGDAQSCAPNSVTLSVRDDPCNPATSWRWYYKSTNFQTPVALSDGVLNYLGQPLMVVQGSATPDLVVLPTHAGFNTVGVSVRCELYNASTTVVSRWASVRTVSQPPDPWIDSAHACFVGDYALALGRDDGPEGQFSTIQWQRETSPGVFTTLMNGPTAWGSIISSATAELLRIDNFRPEDVGAYRAMLTNVCGAVPSNTFVLDICAADFNCSGELEVADIFAFLNAWFAGSASADVNGVAGLQVADIFYFLNLWFSGCA